MTTDHLIELCQTATTIAEELAKDPTQSVDHVVKTLRKEWKEKGHAKQGKGDEAERLERALKCGKFPGRPSDLFLSVYADVLDSMSSDPFANLVSPSLVGSSGVIPLSIVSVIPDIMRHYADLIARAESEVFLATNYWENSHSAGLVSDALRALSKRGVEEGRKGDKRVVVKVVYDRGTPSQVLNNHSAVPPAKWDSVGLPKPEEIEGIQMEVLNYHRPVLGTFHAKYIVVDRKVACVNSNNIQDRPNVEMCVHLEGPIVQSFYDVALFSWANKFEPPMPLLSSPPPPTTDYKFGEENDHLKYIDTEFASKASRDMLGKHYEREAQQTSGGDKSDRRAAQRADGSYVGHVARTAAGIHGGDGDVHGKDDLVGEHPAMQVPDVAGEVRDAKQGNMQDGEQDGRQDRIDPNVDNDVHGEDKIGASTGGVNSGHDGRQSYNSQMSSSHGQGVDGTATGLDERQNRPLNTSQAPADNSEASTNSRPAGPEVLKSEAGSQTRMGQEEGGDSDRVAAITKHLNAANLHEQGTAPDDEYLDDFKPHIMHSPHSPVPIAMVNRAPRGTPGHEKVDDVPQNVAWLSAFKHAQKTIFIQTPTFNASPVIPATIEACRRGVEVTLYLDLGFNDLGEMIPFQGGTNEQVIHNIYTTLNKEGKQDNLKVFWYTAKDQKEPISATKKSRNCHVKFMSVDSQLVILGNGNQDTQSWFHSQETNVMIDSSHLAHEWRTGIDANQNTARFGRLDSKDGIWRAPDGSGRTVESSGTKTSGPLGGLKGISGAIKRVRGTGGF